MALRDNPFGEVRLPLLLMAATSVVVAALVAVILLFADRRETVQTQAYGVTRQVTDKVSAPVGAVLSLPFRWAGDGANFVGGYFFAVSENRRLKAELRDAARWRESAVALADTNRRYKALLGLNFEPPVPMVTGQAISDSRGPFANSRLVNVGQAKGVKVGNPVMSENGLVGRVVGVTETASRVMLLTDAASRTPVMIERTNARAILLGDGGDNPKLAYLRGAAAVAQNDRILTSGDGGLLPRGLPVGRAVKSLDGNWRVVLSSDAGPIDFVRILLFQDFGQLVDTETLNRPSPPPGSPAGRVAPP